MPSSTWLRFAAAFVVAHSTLSVAAPPAADPCAKIAGKNFFPPADALACQKSFPFNETLRQNVLTNVARVFDFFTFEEFYLKSPPPFQESTINIRAKLAELNRTRFATDYDFNRALYDFTTQLNDGHTRWFPDCYTNFQNIIPTPLVSLEENGVQNVFVAPDAVEFSNLIGPEFTGFFASIGFNWQRLAGAKVLQIEGQDAYDYADFIAKTVSGNYLDHGVRVNSAFSSYRISNNAFSQRIGDIAGPTGTVQTSLKLRLIPVNSTRAETVVVPFLTNFLGVPFTNKASFWANNCVANSQTNGIDLKSASISSLVPVVRRMRGDIIDKGESQAVGLPPEFEPKLPQVNGSDGVIKSYILADGITGVMFVGSFGGDFNGFQHDVVSAITQFKASGVTRLLIDLTDNGGMH
ncbi:hypothetical protein ONZ45_g15653 [Pleurotus djamor]|nr:hypothetical protein ONZ45_g15653 [Pleurotus djamor]